MTNRAVAKSVAVDVGILAEVGSTRTIITGEIEEGQGLGNVVADRVAAWCNSGVFGKQRVTNKHWLCQVTYMPITCSIYLNLEYVLKVNATKSIKWETAALYEYVE